MEPLSPRTGKQESTVADMPAQHGLTTLGLTTLGLRAQLGKHDTIVQLEEDENVYAALGEELLTGRVWRHQGLPNGIIERIHLPRDMESSTAVLMWLYEAQLRERDSPDLYLTTDRVVICMNEPAVYVICTHGGDSSELTVQVLNMHAEAEFFGKHPEMTPFIGRPVYAAEGGLRRVSMCIPEPQWYVSTHEWEALVADDPEPTNINHEIKLNMPPWMEIQSSNDGTCPQRGFRFASVTLLSAIYQIGLPTSVSLKIFCRVRAALSDRIGELTEKLPVETQNKFTTVFRLLDRAVSMRPVTYVQYALYLAATGDQTILHSMILHVDRTRAGGVPKAFYWHPEVHRYARFKNAD